jgi:hypothetical protein
MRLPNLVRESQPSVQQLSEQASQLANANLDQLAGLIGRLQVEAAAPV